MLHSTSSLQNSDVFPLFVAFFLISFSMLEYSLDLQNVSFSAVRTVRVLRPLRAINRVPSNLEPGPSSSVRVPAEIAANENRSMENQPNIFSPLKAVFPLFFSGMRILVTLLLDTLPMLGNVLLLCFFVFFIFGIVGVQLWAGLLRNRCFLPENFSL
ncbi:hypothetical protein JD844_011504 [Phrynosoma platyrhinos]|uniref:Ion transport domain-containing protein n=1 Tax=Phrynosoma platyrhinos TaxID=52577 RepID=A0ABQ7TJ09_PHRPL|nr:hypothetical protein JD844_011504 [Phrynosoma platyrhinos]